jgi:bacterioferritin (cytochrome b1)
LIRHISKCLIENKKEEAEKTLGISKKYFSDNSALKMEANLFSAVLSAKVKSRESMSKIIDAACSSVKNINPRLLEEEKGKLIKDINHTLGQKVYEYRIPKYVDYATLQTLFNESRGAKNQKISEIDKIKLKDNLVERLLIQENPNKISVDKNYNNALYKIIVNKFHKKYENTLTEGQKKLLIKYVSSLMNDNVKDKTEFQNFIIEQRIEISKKLSNIQDKDLREDKEISKKIKKVIEEVKNVNAVTITEQGVLKFMQYLQLVDEVSV